MAAEGIRLRTGFVFLGVGAGVFLVALHYANPALILGTNPWTGTLTCYSICTLEGIMDIVGAAAGLILILAGAVTIVERALPRELE